MGKKLSAKGLAFLIEQETGRPNGEPSLRPFPDGGAGGWSIGYGRFLGKYPKQPDITWTVEQSKNALREDVRAAEDVINTFIQVPLTQNQFDALVSFLYNVGINALKPDTASTAWTLLEHLNTANWKALPGYFQSHFITDQAGSPVLRGRRQAEMRLFMEGLS